MSTSSAVFQKVCKDRWRSFGFLVTCSQFFKNVFDSPTFTLLLSDSKTDQASFLDLFLPCCWFDNAHSLCSAFVQFHTETVCVVHLWLFPYPLATVHYEIWVFAPLAAQRLFSESCKEDLQTGIRLLLSWLRTPVGLWRIRVDNLWDRSGVWVPNGSEFVLFQMEWEVSDRTFC